jgi:aspartate-semialdehyde dehydrogenase
MKLVLLGATGAVGSALLELLEERDTPVESLKLLATERSAGTELEVRGEAYEVEALAEGAFRGADVAILAAPPDVAKAWAPRARADGCRLVIDLSPAFRMDPDVPLAVAGVNDAGLSPGAIGARGGLVACPGATALQLVAALSPLHAAAGIERAAVTALQSASAAGRRGVAQLEQEAQALMNGVEPEPGAAFPHRLAFNLLPAAGAFGPSGYGEEELRVAAETRRAMNALELPVTATVVRVPVFYGHAAAVNVRTRRKLSAAEAREALKRSPWVKVIDEPAQGVYPMPMLAVSDDAVHAGRVRDDLSQPNGLELFLVAENLRTCAASNALRLAEKLAGGAAR